MHVPLRRRKVLMPSQLLNRSGRRSLHRKVRAEGVAQDVNPWLHLSLLSRLVLQALREPWKHVSGTVVLGYTVAYLVIRRLPALNVLDLRLWIAEAAA